MNIPKEHHRVILGKAGTRLQKLELETATKITIPRPDERSNEVTIVGAQEGVQKARHEIQLISDEQVSNRLFTVTHFQKSFIRSDDVTNAVYPHLISEIF